MVVDTWADLERLATTPRRWRGTVERVEIRIPGLGRGEGAAVAARVNALLSVCGCTAGAVAALSFLSAYLIVLFGFGAARQLSPLPAWLLAAVGFLGTGAAAKTAAVAWARVRLKRVIARMVR